MNGEYSDFMSESQAGKYVGKRKADIRSGKAKATTGGNVKFDIKKILSAIESGEMSESEANDFLVKSTGYKITSDGELIKADSGGIETITNIRKKAKETIKNYEDYDPDELLDKYDEIVEAREDFQFDYDAYMEEYGPKSAKSDPTISKLYGKTKYVKDKKTGKRKRKGVREESFTYDDFIKVAKKLRDETKDLKRQAMKNPGKNVFGGNR